MTICYNCVYFLAEFSCPASDDGRVGRERRLRSSPGWLSRRLAAVQVSTQHHHKSQYAEVR